MTLEPTVAVLGAGNIGSALISGLLESKALKPEKIVAADVSEQQLTALATKHRIQVLHGNNREAARQAEVIVMAVKPYLVGEVLDEIHPVLRAGQIVMSVAAGVSIEFIERQLARKKAKSSPAAKTTQPIIRAMPNLAMTVHASATALCANEAATGQHRQIAEQIFQSVGTVAWVSEDKICCWLSGLD